MVEEFARQPEQKRQEPNQSTRRTITKTTTYKTKSSDINLDEGCTGDFAFDHLKQQENLSRKTLAELEEKQIELQREDENIKKEWP